MAELKPYNPTIRDRIASALMGEARPGSARANMVEGLMGSRGIGTTGIGLADLTPMGIPMAGQEAQRDAQAGNYLGAGLNAMAVIPAAKAPVRAAQQGIKAYHGSPHSFDKFDLSKIGTGEGAQAYGHGLYFAEQEEIAKGYRDRIAGAQWIDKRGVPVQTNDLVDDISREARKSGFGVVEADQLAFNWRDFVNNPAAAPDPIRRVLEQRGIGLKTNGSMYEVNIRANPDDFLDWDKPMGDQRANELLRAIDWNARGGSSTGRDRYLRMADVMGPNEATSAMREAGIPGIKYLDGGSRAAGDGSRNYVVFDDKLIDIVRKYGLAGLMAGGLGAYGATGGQPPQAYQPAPPKL